LLEFLARTNPKLVIKLLCHWLNEKNPNVEERFLTPRLINPVGVAKKFSQLSVLSILNIIRQDASLWQFYAATPFNGVTFNLKVLPYILLELMFDLGGPEGREKVVKVIQKCRTTLGGGKQAEILKNFKTDTVLDIFEMLPQTDVGMLLKSGMRMDDLNIVAFWLTHWDMRRKETKQSPISVQWLGRLPGDRAFRLEKLMKELEFRREKALDEEDN
jgi:hypothetical protein